MKSLQLIFIAILSNHTLAEVNEAYLYRTGIWKTKLIPVCWENEGFSREKQLVKETIERTWQAESALQFYGWSQCTANSVGIRIGIGDTGPHTKALGGV